MKAILLIFLISFMIISCDKEKKECISKNDCKAWQICSSENKCELAKDKCSKDEDCKDGKKCDTSHVCSNICKKDKDCKDYEICNLTFNKCQLAKDKCSKNEHCLDYEKCNNNSCVLQENRCKKDSDCSEDESCNLSNNNCIKKEEKDVCKDYKGCDKLPNTYCKKNPKGEAACYCKDGYKLNPDGVGCIKNEECSDDNVGNSREDAKKITIPYEASHTYCPGSTDFFKFSMNAGEYIIIKTNSSKNLSLFLYKGNSVVATGKNLFYKTEEAGEFYVIVKTQGLAANYDIKFTMDCKSNNECGFNQVCNNKKCEEHICSDDNIGNTPESATEINLPYNEENKICTAKADFYKLNLIQGDNIVINSSVPPQEWVLMELYDDITVSHEVTWGTKKLVYHVEETKTYYLKVYKDGIVDLNYSISMKKACSSDDECEGIFNSCNLDTGECDNGTCTDDGIGNTPESASSITIAHESDYTICSSKADYFKFNLETDELIIVKTSFSNRVGDLDIELYRENPNENNMVAKSKTPKNIEKFSFTATESGEYYLKVFPFLAPNSNEFVENKYNLIIKKECSEHEDCNKGEYCSNNKKCISYPNCSKDDECENISSINNDDDFYCELPNKYKASCNLHIAPSCGDGSNKSSLAENLTIGENKNSTLCLLDEDWYKFNLTENTSDLNVKLSFDKGKFDLNILGPDNTYPAVAYLNNKKSTNNNQGLDIKMLPKGLYYIHIKRHKNWNTNELELVNYSLSVSKTGNSECNENNCFELTPKRSTCNESTKACETTIEDYSVALGGSCDNLMDCMEVPNLHACHAGICVSSCKFDKDCQENFVCQSLGFLVKPKVCIENCTSKPDSYCKNILGKASAICEDGKCK